MAFFGAGAASGSGAASTGAASSGAVGAESSAVASAFFLRGAAFFLGSGWGISPSGLGFRFGERMCIAQATSTVDDAVFTSIPARCRRASTLALGSPSSFAIS